MSAGTWLNGAVWDRRLDGVALTFARHIEWSFRCDKAAQQGCNHRSGFAIARLARAVRHRVASPEAGGTPGAAACVCLRAIIARRGGSYCAGDGGQPRDAS